MVIKELHNFNKTEPKTIQQFKIEKDANNQFKL